MFASQFTEFASPVTPGGKPCARSVLNATARTQVNTAYAAHQIGGEHDASEEEGCQEGR
jgi:hypothetical protein